MYTVTRVLGDICDEVGGVIRTGPFGSQLHQSDYVDDGLPVVMPQNILDGRVSLAGIAKIGTADSERLRHHRLRKGDIVYGRRGDIGRRALITDRENGWLCGTGCMRVSLGDTVLDPQYLSYYLGQEDVIGWIQNQAVGATMPNLNTGILRSVPVTYPLLPTQRKIAAILSAYDDLIENNTRRIRILEEMAQAIYREWFVNFRFPGHEKVKMVESDLGLIPEGWEVRRLEDVCSRITDGSHFSPRSVEDGYLMASVKDMHAWGFDTEQCRRISSPDYYTLVRNGCQPVVDDVLIAKDGSYLKHAFVIDKMTPLVVLSSIAILRPNALMLPSILCRCLLQPEIKARLSGYVSGVALPRIILKDFRQFAIVVPPHTTQKQYDDLVGPALKMCYRLTEANNNLRQTRDLLLPKLVSGEVDVSELEIQMGTGQST